MGRKATLNKNKLPREDGIDQLYKQISAKGLPDKISKNIDARLNLVDQLHERYYWHIVTKQLSTKELDYFEKCWASLIEQFSTSEVTHTDELLIKSLVMDIIALERLLIQKRDIYKEIDILDKNVEREMKNPPLERNQPNIDAWNQEKMSLISTLESMNNTESDLKSAQEKMYKNLRSTREQRLKNAHEAENNFWMKLAELDAKEERVKHGIVAEKLKMAGLKEYDRLCEPIEFEDGTTDCGFLNSKSVKNLQDLENLDYNI